MYLKKYNLKNKVALVTGAGKGLGKACAIALAEAGANLIIISRTNKDLHFTLVFLIILDTWSKSFFVLLTINRFAPASAKAIAQALPKPLPAPVTRATLFFKLYFFKYIL